MWKNKIYSLGSLFGKAETKKILKGNSVNLKNKKKYIQN